MKKPTVFGRLISAYPIMMLSIFFVIPLALMIAVSFYRRDPMGFYQVDFVFDNYLKMFSSFYYKVSLRSLWSAALSSLIVVAIAFPTTYIISDLSRRWQTFWVILLLALMCLSEVIIGFSWMLLVSETAGIPKFLNWVGLLDNPRSLSPGFTAMMLAMVSLGFSIVALMFYPQMVQRDRSIEEAAQTLGTPPHKVFYKVILPIFRPAILMSFLTMFVYYLGVYVVPTMLGRPQDWNMSVVITDKAVSQSNMPLGSALSVAMMGLTMIVLIVVSFLAKRGQR